MNMKFNDPISLEEARKILNNCTRQWIYSLYERNKIEGEVISKTLVISKKSLEKYKANRQKLKRK
jgi:hypothetical protein